MNMKKRILLVCLVIATTMTIDRLASACESYGQAQGCFDVDPCGRVAPFDAINYCGDFVDPTTQIPVVCGGCPLPSQQCGAVVTSIEGNETYTYEYPNTCYLTCASESVQCGSILAQSTSLEPTSPDDTIRCGGCLVGQTCSSNQCVCGPCAKGQYCDTTAQQCFAITAIPAVPAPMTAGLGVLVVMLGLTAARKASLGRRSPPTDRS